MKTHNRDIPVPSVMREPIEPACEECGGPWLEGCRCELEDHMRYLGIPEDDRGSL